MAYAAAVVWKESRTPAGGRRIHLKVTQTEAAAASAWCTKNGVITGVTVTKEDGRSANVPMPQVGVVRFYKANITAGTGTSVQPRLGHPDTPGTFTSLGKDVMFEVAAAASYISESGEYFFAFPVGDDRVMSGQSVVNAGSDNTIVTHIVIDEVG